MNFKVSFSATPFPIEKKGNFHLPHGSLVSFSCIADRPGTIIFHARDQTHQWPFREGTRRVMKALPIELYVDFVQESSKIIFEFVPESGDERSVCEFIIVLADGRAKRKELEAELQEIKVMTGKVAPIRPDVRVHVHMLRLIRSRMVRLRTLAFLPGSLTREPSLVRVEHEKRALPFVSHSTQYLHR